MINWPDSCYWKQNFEIHSNLDLFDIHRISSISNLKSHSILFVKEMTPGVFEQLASLENFICITKKIPEMTYEDLFENGGIIFDEDPRYRFAAILEPLWTNASIRGSLLWNQRYQAFLGENVLISDDAFIEPYASIGNNSIVGDNVYIMAGAKIGPNVTIGSNSIVRENAVIGGWGFGIAQSKGNKPIRIPHVGGVVIGENVEIGALTTIASGTIEPTMIHDYVKINDHAHIAHNCTVGKYSIIAACADISGSVSIGKNCWIAPNASIINGITIGDDSVVGIGTVVLHDVGSKAVVVGNPGRIIRQNVENSCQEVPNVTLEPSRK